MPKPRFDELEERLLCAGIAPAHVQRYVRELVDHYDDLYRAECAEGLQPAAAEHAARTRLGSDDVLAESLLAQPELRSVAARYPALVFGAAPFLTWLVLETLSVVVLRTAVANDEIRRSLPPLDRLAHFVELYCLAFVRVLPMFLSAAVFWSGMRRRSGALWPITGAAAVTIAAASIAVYVVDGQVGLSCSLLPRVGWNFPSYSPLVESVARASWMLALTLVPYVLWLARRAHAHRP